MLISLCEPRVPSYRQATAIGNLFGSFVAAHLCASNPDRFTSLVLVHPLIHTPEGFEAYKGWVTKFKDPASPAHGVKEDGAHWEAVWKRRTSRLSAELNTRVGQDELRGPGHRCPPRARLFASPVSPGCPG